MEAHGATMDWSSFLAATKEAEEEWCQQQATDKDMTQWVQEVEQQAAAGEAEMMGAMVEQWVQEVEAPQAAAVGATLDGYGQHGCGEVVVLGGGEAATIETTKAEGKAEAEEGAVAKATEVDTKAV